MPKQNYSKRHRYEVVTKLGPNPHRSKVTEAAGLLDVSTSDIRKWIREFSSDKIHPSKEESVSKIENHDDIEDTDEAYETVSFYLPSEIVDLCRELADLRQKIARDKIKTSKKPRRGLKSKIALRRSASAIVNEALQSYREKIESEILKSQKKLIKPPTLPLTSPNEEEERKAHSEYVEKIKKMYPFMMWSQRMNYDDHLKEILLELKRSKVKTFPGMADHLNSMGKGTKSGLRWSKDGLRKFLKRAGKSIDDLV
jgi:hypothetical protein